MILQVMFFGGLVGKFDIVIHWGPRNYGSKQTDPEGAARGWGLFT